jgi:hypothetical protein
VLGDDPAALERAMKVVATDLAGLMPMTVTAVGHDASGKEVTLVLLNRYSNFRVAPATCTFSYHLKIESNGRVVRDADDSIAVRNATMFDLADTQLMYDQLPGLKGFHVVPRLFMLRLLSPSGSIVYSFRDPVSAARVWGELATVLQMCVDGP